MKLYDYLQRTFHYSDFQIGQLHYIFMSILSEISKIILMGIFFYFTDQLSVYFYTALLLCALRTCTGGLHFKHYISCLGASFLIFFVGICILPHFYVTRAVQLLLLLLCVICNYRLAPIVSCYRPVPNGLLIKKSKRQSFIIITLYAVIVFIMPDNPYVFTGFWIIILQSAQLIVAKILQKGGKENEVPC